MHVCVLGEVSLGCVCVCARARVCWEKWHLEVGKERKEAGC